MDYKLNTQEIERITSAIRVKMSARMMTFESVEISSNKEKLLFKFSGLKHPTMKNIKILSHESIIHDSSLFTQVHIRLRFLHGNLKSPIIGMTLTNFKIVLS